MRNMKKVVKDLIHNLLHNLISLIDKYNGYKKKDAKEEDILESIREAREEWLSKEEYFNHATDPDLVDFAIYDIEASKRKYAYLLKKVREEKNV